ncbi:hypothetical protein BDZ97DRAFT_1913067 [Flammula alnicola]|nr:hypothetical protein BDZ97DRAFT_1913067 [Flammula alnicola]
MGRTKVIRVSVYGPSGSGKTTLVERLNKHEFIRAADGQKFCLLMKETDATLELFDDAQFVILTFDIEGDYRGSWRSHRSLVDEHYENQRDLCCMIGSKRDIIPQDYSAADISTLQAPTYTTLVTGIRTFMVSARSGFGVEEVSLFISNQIYPVSLFVPNVLGRLQTWILDTVASIFSLPVPQNVNRNTDDTLEIADDSMIYELSKSPEALAFNKALAAYNPFFKWASASAWKIAPTLVAKRAEPVERTNTEFVRSHTNIPVPQSRYPHLKENIVTEFIPGQMLLRCWDSLSPFYQFRIACTLRCYVSQLRRLTSTSPGEMDGGHVIGHVFEDTLYNGPFRDSEVFRHWINHVSKVGWLRTCMDFRATGDDFIPTPPVLLENDSQPLVFTHCDISLSNVILSDEVSCGLSIGHRAAFIHPGSSPLG